MTLLVNQKTCDSVLAGQSYWNIAAGWTKELHEFEKRAQAWRLYE